MQPSVVLINPPLSLADRYGKDMQKFGAVSEPLGLAYIAAYLETVDVPVRIIDAPALKLGIDDVIEDLSRQVDAVVGITLLTPAFKVVADLCSAIKQSFPDRVIVLGGAHPTALPERTLQEIPAVDIVCIGEGEVSMSEIVSDSLRKDRRLNVINGICYRDEQEIIMTEMRTAVRDLDLIPPPARHLLPMEKYHLTASRVSGAGFCPTIIVARGCPFSCTYCSRTFGKTFRAHSIDRIISEIKSLIADYGVKQINVEADTLTVKNKFITELCNALIEQKISEKVKWTCESRVDTVNENLLRLMKQAGCWQISYGVETGTQRLLDMINKSVSLQQIEDIFALTKRIGISIRGFFMLGLPSETREDSLATIAFAKKLDPLWAQFTVTVPYPGTKMFDDLDSSGKIRNYDWSTYNTWSGWKERQALPFVAEGRTMEELVKLQKQALRQFYVRPKVIFRFLKNMRSIYDLQKYLVGFYVLAKSKFS
ncbi:MAG: cobalamin-dependent protein [Deltaproteobacteria bacterium]|nr:cobalamin-dependent protein [Deltaproteobacteria bacterium]